MDGWMHFSSLVPQNRLLLLLLYVRTNEQTTCFSNNSVFPLACAQKRAKGVSCHLPLEFFAILLNNYGKTVHI